MFEFNKDHIKIDPDMEVDCDIGQIVTAYMETWFDVDEKFGINTADDDDTWVNFYGKYNTLTGELTTEYEIDHPDSGEWHDYIPTENEKSLIIEMMEDCCRQHHGCTLKEYVEQVNHFDMQQGGLS